MKKLLALLLMSALLFSTAACGESDPTDNGEELEENEKNDENEEEAEVTETETETESDTETEAADTTEEATEEVTEEPETTVETTESERLWEIEDNNSTENATRIMLNTDYFGNLEADYNTEEDWYEFTLDRERKVALYFKPGKQKYSDSYWDISIRTAEDPSTDHWQKYVGGNIGTSVSPTWLLPAGTYYIQLESSNKHSTDTYSVRITTRS